MIVVTAKVQPITRICKKNHFYFVFSLFIRNFAPANNPFVCIGLVAQLVRATDS